MCVSVRELNGITDCGNPAFTAVKTSVIGNGFLLLTFTAVVAVMGTAI